MQAVHLIKPGRNQGAVPLRLHPKNRRVVFNIKGNDYRLIVAIAYQRGWMFVKIVGTHKAYDKVNAETVDMVVMCIYPCAQSATNGRARNMKARTHYSSHMPAAHEDGPAQERLVCARRNLITVIAGQVAVELIFPWLNVLIT